MEDAGLPQKKYKPEEIVAKLRRVDVLLSQDHPLSEVPLVSWTLASFSFRY